MPTRGGFKVMGYKAMNNEELNKKAKEFLEEYKRIENERIQVIKKLVSEWGVGIVEMECLVQKAYLQRAMVEERNE